MAKQKLVDGGDYLVQQFYGLQTAVKNPKELLLGQPQDSLNFITGYNTKTKTGDNIQLRLGSALLGQTRLGAGKVNAMAVGEDVNGVQYPFFVAGGQAYYYNPVTQDVATVVNGTFVTMEDMTMELYSDLFGPLMYMGSPNTGINVISVANKQMKNLSQGDANGGNGYLTIRQNFGWLWDYLNTSTGIHYRQNINQSDPDQISPSSASIQNPQGSTGVTGNGVLTSFSGNLPGFSNIAFQIQIGAPINSFAVTTFVMAGTIPALTTINFTGGDVFANGDYAVIQGSNFESPQVNDIICLVIGHAAGQITVTPLLTPLSGTNNTYSPASATVSKLELFEDDSNGNLSSLLGSAGTINYLTGAWTIHTQAAVPNGLNIDVIYFNGIPGVIAFSAGSWSQHGGVIKAIKFFNNQIYSFHTVNTWLLNLGYSSVSATTTTQQQYRQNLGTSFFRAAYEKGEGVLFLDNTEQNNPHFRILQISPVSSATEPEDLSSDIDLSEYDPSTCNVGSIGNFDFLSLQSINNDVASGHNDTTFLRNNISGFWDKTDLRIAVMDSYNGAIIAGDTISQNLMQLFTGQDDDGAPINAYWISGQMNLGFSGLKQFNLFHVDGFIGPSQVFNIYAQYDTGAYILIGSVYGNGNYVNMNNSVLVGQGLGGSNPIGGLGNGQLTGYYFTQDIPIWTPLFQYVSIKFVPGVNLSGQVPQPAFGALQINAGWGFRDCRIKSVKAPANTIGR